MKIKIIIALTASAALSGCAMPSIQPPADNGADYRQSYQADFDSVWEATVDWFATNNIPIKNIEKDSGIIGSEYSLGADYSQVDCGTVDPGGMYVLENENIVANLNVLVRENYGTVTVQPNVFGQGSYFLRDVWNNVPSTLKADRCVSTGELEQSLHNYLNARL